LAQDAEKAISLRSRWPCLGQGAAQGEEAVLADSGLAGKKSGLFEHPEGCSFDVLDIMDR